MSLRSMRLLTHCYVIGGTTIQTTVRRATTRAGPSEKKNRKRCHTIIIKGDKNSTTNVAEIVQTGFSPPGRATGPLNSDTVSSAPSVSSSPQWVERALQYDAAKVRHLANVFTGVEAAVERPRTTASVEQQLHRQHRCNIPAPTARERKGSARRIARDHLQELNAKSACARDAACGNRVQECKVPWASTWTSELFILDASRFAGLARDLVRLHQSLTVTDNRAQPQNPASSDHVHTLTSLLNTSRLAHYMRNQSAASKGISLEDVSPTSPDAALHALTTLASAFEASVVSIRRVGIASAPEYCIAPPEQSECSIPQQMNSDQEALLTAKTCYHGRVCAYFSLLTEILHAFIEVLAPLTRLPLSMSSTAVTRVDLVLLAVFSLMKAAEVCAYIARVSSSTDRADVTSVKEFDLSKVSDALQRLCLQTSVLLFRSSSLSVAVSSKSSEREMCRAYRPSSFLLLKEQSEKVLTQMQVMGNAPMSAGCVSALKSMMLVYVVSTLTRSIAEENAIKGAGSSDEAQVSNGELAAAGEQAPTKSDGDTAALQWFTEGEKFHLAKEVEVLWAEIKPLRMISPSEIGQVQHRTVHTAVNVSLAAWWRATATAPSAPLPTLYWNKSPDHIAVLLCSYIGLLAECRVALFSPHINKRAKAAPLPWSSAAASSSPSRGAWFVPFYSRLIRVGLDVQLETTLLAAFHLGIEPRAPLTPETPIMKWIASRRAQRLRHRGLHGTSEGGVAPIEGVEGDAPWARVYRLCGGVRVAAAELLYCAVTEASRPVAETPPTGAHGSPWSPSQPCSKDMAMSAPASTKARNICRDGVLAAALVGSVSRMFFPLLRVQYLFAYYTDETYTEWAAEEECRRVYAACIGVLVWLRELAAPFSVSAAEPMESKSAPPSSAMRHDDQQRQASSPGKWKVCGTTSAVAVDGAFFFAYFLYHWEGNVAGYSPGSSSGVTQGHHTGLDAALASDGVVSAMPCPSIGPLLTRATAIEYTKEMLFQLQHDTARQLHHLRATDRLHHFTGELRDRARLLEDSLLRQRHVSSTLSIVQAHCKQPTLLWMPLSQVQEMGFLLSQYPQLLNVEGSASTPDPYRDSEQENGDATVPSHGFREYPTVRVGDVTCSFARLHGYLVRRLHVLSGILREYRSLLLESSSDGVIDPYGVSDDDGASVRSVTAPSFQSWLLDNAKRSPQLEVHRRNNYRWAHVWAVQLHEEFSRLPAQMEGVTHWTSGVMRTLDRMERTMNDTYRQGLFFNVVKSQQQYREVQRSCLGTTRPSPQAERAAPTNAVKADEAGKPQVLDLVVVRESERVPLGVVLDGDARVRRVQVKVARPDAVADTIFEDERELLESPFARALVQRHKQQQQGKQERSEVPMSFCDLADVVGWRVLQVDGTVVRTGRDVATYIRGKTVVTITLGSCSPSE